MSLTIHHLRRSQSERIVWLCEEIGTLNPDFHYELIQHERDSVTALAPSSLKDLSAARTAPVMIDNTVTPPVLLAELQAIVEYIIQMHGGGHLSVAPGSPNYAHYLSWYNFANGSFQAGLARLGTIDLVLKAVARVNGMGQDQPSAADGSARQVAGEADPLTAMIKARLFNHLRMIDTRLGEAQYLAGLNLSAADVMIVFSLTTMRGFYPYSLAKYYNILRYLSVIAQHPGYKRALEKAEPGMTPLIDAEVEAFDYAAFK